MSGTLREIFSVLSAHANYADLEVVKEMPLYDEKVYNFFIQSMSEPSRYAHAQELAQVTSTLRSIGQDPPVTELEPLVQFLIALRVEMCFVEVFVDNATRSVYQKFLVPFQMPRRFEILSFVKSMTIFYASQEDRRTLTESDKARLFFISSLVPSADQHKLPALSDILLQLVDLDVTTFDAVSKMMWTLANSSVLKFLSTFKILTALSGNLRLEIVQNFLACIRDIPIDVAGKFIDELGGKVLVEQIDSPQLILTFLQELKKWPESQRRQLVTLVPIKAVEEFLSMIVDRLQGMTIDGLTEARQTDVLRAAKCLYEDFAPGWCTLRAALIYLGKIECVHQSTAIAEFIRIGLNTFREKMHSVEDGFTFINFALHDICLTPDRKEVIKYRDQITQDPLGYYEQWLSENKQIRPPSMDTFLDHLSRIHIHP